MEDILDQSCMCEEAKEEIVLENGSNGLCLCRTQRARKGLQQPRVLTGETKPKPKPKPNQTK